jgi:hypothetical protein
VKDREHKEQVAVVKWFDMQYSPLRGRLFAVPNGGERNPRVAMKLRLEGVRPGVPDLFLPVPRCGFHGLFIEMKAKGATPSRDGKLSENQSDWLDFLGGQGYMAVVCIGADAAIETIINYLGEKHATDNATGTP